MTMASPASPERKPDDTNSATQGNPITLSNPITQGNPITQRRGRNEEPETGITEGGRAGRFRDVLSPDHARRGKPPVHFADMEEGERIDAAKALGMPKFRVNQLAQHYYAHFETDVENFTDFPAALRQTAKDEYFPYLIDEELVQTADHGKIGRAHV